MDISQGPGNNITVIEEFIEKRYPQTIQILHVNGNHWITVSTATCGTDIAVYDSMHSSLSKRTQQLLAKLVHTDSEQVTVNMCNVCQQTSW